MKGLLLFVVLAAFLVSIEAAAIQETADGVIDLTRESIISSMDDILSSNEAATVNENDVADLTMESFISSRHEILPSNEAAEIQETDVAVRANLNTGSISSRDRVLRRDYFRMLPVSGMVQYADISYSGSSSIRIAAIRAIEQGATQYATPSIRAGGIGRNSVTIRLTTARGRGFYYMVEIWGR